MFPMFIGIYLAIPRMIKMDPKNRKKKLGVNEQEELRLIKTS